MEQSSSQQLKVGLFLIVGLTLILLSIFFMGADRALFTSYFRVYSVFTQVQGLAEGSVVSLSGVVVGNVERIDFDKNRAGLRVTLSIDRKFSDQIAADSKVEIRTQGALGDKFVYIIPGLPDSPSVKEGGELPVADSVDIFGIISSRGNETERIFDIIAEVYKITKTLNQDGQLNLMMKNFGQTAANLRDASSDLRAMTDEIKNKNSTAKLNASIDKMNSILTRIDKGQGTLGLLINDSTLHAQLKSLLGDSKRSDHVKSVIRTSIKSSEAPD